MPLLSSLSLSPTSSSDVSQGRQQIDVSGPTRNKCDATSLGMVGLLYGDATRGWCFALVQCSANS